MDPINDQPVINADLSDLEASALKEMRTERDEMAVEVATALTAERSLTSRLAAGVGAGVEVRLGDTAHIRGMLVQVGCDYLRVADEHGFWLLALAWIEAVSSCGAGASEVGLRTAVGATSPQRLASALRELVLLDGQVNVWVGSHWLAGRLCLVGADYLELDGVCVPLSRVGACRVWY